MCAKPLCGERAPIPSQGHSPNVSHGSSLQRASHCSSLGLVPHTGVKQSYQPPTGSRGLKHGAGQLEDASCSGGWIVCVRGTGEPPEYPVLGWADGGAPPAEMRGTSGLCCCFVSFKASAKGITLRQSCVGEGSWNQPSPPLPHPLPPGVDCQSINLKLFTPFGVENAFAPPTQIKVSVLESAEGHSCLRTGWNGAGTAGCYWSWGGEVPQAG